MKRVFLISFCFLYFFSSVGVAFNLHYCGGKLKNISLSHSDESKCCGKKRMKSKNCCKEKSFVYKVKNNQESGGKYFSYKNVTNFSAVYVNYSSTRLAKTTTNLFLLPDFHAPPDYVGQPTYIVNGVFRI